MPVTTPAGRMRRGTQFPNIIDQVTTILVAIQRNEVGSPTEIVVSPNVGSESTVYLAPETRREGRPAPALDFPREIVWVVNDLHPGETLLVEPKSGQLDPFAFRSFSIVYPDHLVSSGPVARGQLPRGGPFPLSWSYNLLLDGPHPQVTLDPVIIIDEDP